MAAGGVSFGMAALAGLSVLLVLGGVLFVWGLRGRRVGEEPHCRKCGYNLTGLTSDKCPECGSSICGRNVVLGVRRRRWRLWVPGLLLLSVSLGGFGWAGYTRGKAVNWYAYLPEFALVYQARQDDVPAIDELVRRYKAGTSGAAPLVKLVPLALTRQGVTQKPLSIWAWTNLLASLEVAGCLSQEQLEQFHEQIVAIKLECRPSVRAGEDVQVSVGYWMRGASGPVGAWGIEGGRLRVGDWTQDRVLVSESEALSQPGRGTTIGYTVPGHCLAEPGAYKVEFSATNVFTQPYFERPIALSLDLEVLPADAAPTLRIVANPALAGEFRKAITISTSGRSWGGSPGSSRVTTYLEIDVHAPAPMDGAFIVLGRVADREFDLGTFTVRKSQQIKSQLECRADLSDVEYFVPVLRSSADVAKTTTDILEIWDGELQFAPVKINRVPVSGPSSLPAP